MFKKIIYILIASSILFASNSAFADFEVGSTMYTTHGFFTEKGKSYTTNYRAGICIPRGSKITVIKVTKKYADILVDRFNIGKVRLFNPVKHSRLSTEMYLNRMLSKKALGFRKYAKKKRDYIQSCRLSVGMSKNEVIASVGYPPAHVTPTIEMNQWKYWKKRFNTEMLYFSKSNNLQTIQE